MMDHPTSSTTGISSNVIGVVLVGPPASGKSTVCDIFSDIGVPVVDVEQCSRDTDDSVYSELDEAVLEGGRDATENNCPPVVVFDGVGDQETVDAIEAKIPRGVLVARVEAEHSKVRTDRYVDRELDTEGDVVSTDEIHQLREELYERELEEHPYPQHTVEIINSNSVSMIELTVRMDNLLQALS